MSYSFLLGLQIAKHPLSHCDHSTIMICRVDVHCNTSSYPQCYSTAKLSSHVFVYCVSWQILHGTHQRMYALIQKLHLAIIYQLENITCYIISISDARQSIFWTVVPLPFRHPITRPIISSPMFSSSSSTFDLVALHGSSHLHENPSVIIRSDSKTFNPEYEHSIQNDLRKHRGKMSLNLRRSAEEVL